jgi:serine/threonine protein kinase
LGQFFDQIYIDEGEIPWNASATNPATRIDSLSPLVHPKWRIDGNEDSGRRFFAIPLMVRDLHPSRIDVFIPDPSSLPLALQKVLDVSANFHMRDGRIERLGICQHVLRALEHWSSTKVNFEQYYKSLPLGSQIIIENMSPSPREMNIVVEMGSVDKQLLTIKELAHLWELSTVELPPPMLLEQIKLISVFNDKVSLVEVATDLGRKKMILKASTDSSRAIYHELRMLMTIPSHPNIVKKPVYLALMDGQEGRNSLVVGFLLEYYPGGCLRDILPLEANSLRLCWEDQSRWAKQVTSALLHLNAASIFYSDMKPENIVLSLPSENRFRDSVLIDLEQMGAQNVWTAPEIIILERLQIIVKHEKNPDIRSKYAKLLTLMLGDNVSETAHTYDNPPMGYNTPWISLTVKEREAAQVFALGKVLFCIFEGVGCITSMISPSFAQESDLQFPDFVRTPPLLQRLILDCTQGAREHDRGRPFIVRVNGKLYPLGKTGCNGEPLGTSRDVIHASRQLWLNELHHLERFVEAKLRYNKGQAQASDIEELSYLKRPKLWRVMQCLEELG